MSSAEHHQKYTSWENQNILTEHLPNIIQHCPTAKVLKSTLPTHPAPYQYIVREKSFVVTIFQFCPFPWL